MFQYALNTFSALIFCFHFFSIIQSNIFKLKNKLYVLTKFLLLAVQFFLGLSTVHLLLDKIHGVHIRAKSDPQDIF